MTSVDANTATSRLDWVVAGWVALVLAMATLLLCRAADSSIAAEARPPLAWLNEILTIPIELTSIADLRGYVLPVGLAGMLVLVVISQSAANGRVIPALSGAPGTAARSSDGTILVLLIIGCGAICVISALVNGCWELSRGWLFQFACGGLWAILLSSVRSGLVRRIVGMALVVAALSTAATFYHRQVLDILYVRWPIGPITLSAALGAVWAAIGLGWLTAPLGARAPDEPRHRPVAIIGVGCVIAASVLLAFVSGRRGSLLGLIAAATLVALLIASTRLGRRMMRIGFVTFAGVAIAIGGFWVRGQLASTTREVSGPIAVRLAYSRGCLDLLGEHPVIGIGPDMTICDLTSLTARDRAERPHVLHGDIVPAAHNEWLQGLVELGIPGGLMYLAIPVWALIRGARAWRVGRAGRDLILAASCGLVAIVVIELTSINLRNPTIPVWYWTLIGLTIAASRTPSPAPAPGAAGKPTPGIMRFGLIGAGIVILLVVAGDLQRAIAAARAPAVAAENPERATWLFESATHRFGADNMLRAWVALGRHQSEIAGRLRNVTVGSNSPPAAGEAAERAAATWRQLWDICPGYPGAGGQLAYALQLAGRHDESRRILAIYLDKLDPYDAGANVLFAPHEGDSELTLTCMRRALRDGALDARKVELIRANLIESDRSGGSVLPPAEWQRRVETAREDCQTRAEPDWKDPLAPETLRAEVARLEAKNLLREAAQTQTVAANAYAQLERSNSPHRRPAVAERDAWQKAADLTFRVDPTDTESAYVAIVQAERYAVLGISHEYLRHPNPHAEFVGGTVHPMESPAYLRPLWRLSVMIRLAGGREEDLAQRVLMSLPPEQVLVPGIIDRVLAEMARELVEMYRDVPVERQPRGMNRVRALAGTAAASKPAP